MAQQPNQETLLVSAVDGNAIVNTTTPTSLLAGTQPSGIISLQPNWLVVGRTIRVTAAGRISTVVTTPGTLTLDVRLGGVVVANGGAMSLNIVAKTNVPWRLEWLLQCRAAGAAANLMHQGEWVSEAVVGATLPTVGGASAHLLPNAAPAVGSNVDGTGVLVFDLCATWSIANAANSIRLHKFIAELLP